MLERRIERHRQRKIERERERDGGRVDDKPATETMQTWVTEWMPGSPANRKAFTWKSMCRFRPHGSLRKKDGE